MDAACSSGVYAIDIAMKAIHAGQCDAAVVGCTNLCLRPTTTLGYNKIGVLSPDGRSKCLDASGS